MSKSNIQFKWKLSQFGELKTLTISGNGAMPNYDSEKDVPWYSRRDSISRIVFSGNLTSIGKSAFSGCTNLTYVTIQLSSWRGTKPSSEPAWIASPCGFAMTGGGGQAASIAIFPYGKRESEDGRRKSKESNVKKCLLRHCRTFPDSAGHRFTGKTDDATASRRCKSDLRYFKLSRLSSRKVKQSIRGRWIASPCGFAMTAGGEQAASIAIFPYGKRECEAAGCV
jgi:hypothetical protein